jgi:hypothetical protein
VLCRACGLAREEKAPAPPFDGFLAERVERDLEGLDVGASRCVTRAYGRTRAAPLSGTEVLTTWWFEVRDAGR